MKKLYVAILFVLSGCSLLTPEVLPTPTIAVPTTTPTSVPTVPTARPPTITNSPGYDVLGVASYCSTFLSAPKLPAFSTLYGNGKNDFGNPFPCIEAKISQGGVKKIQIDLIDATCVRNGVCPKGSPKMPALSAIRARARVVNVHAVLHPNIEWWVSPWLEHDIKDSNTVKKGCAEVAKVCPTCRCINSPMSGARPAGIPIELHGTKVTAFAVSGDGSSTFDADNFKNDKNSFQFRDAGKDQTYAWWNALNNRCTGEHSFVPITQRTERPELWQFQMAYKLMTTNEDAIPNNPPQCKSVREVSGSEIVKVTAEKYCNKDKDDGRGNKPLLIIRKSGKRGDRMNVYSSKGELVGCFAYYGTYTVKGTHRWYMGSCSGQNPWELYTDMNNQEWSFVDMGKGSCLRINAIRRMGVYR